MNEQSNPTAFAPRTHEFNRITESALLPSEATAPWWNDELQNLPSSPDLRREKVIQMARRRFEQATDWVVFFREVLSSDGLVSAVFPTPEVLADFERCPEFQEIQQMVAQLRERKPNNSDEQEPTRVITVRLPKSLHQSLLNEADRKHTSMNKLCISKLLQMIDDAYVPADKSSSKKKRRASKAAAE